MLKTLMKVVLTVVLAYAAYRGAEFYSIYKTGTYLQACAPMQDICRLTKSNPSDEMVTEFMRDTYSCMSRKQGFPESVLFPIPKEWSDPSPNYFKRDDFMKRFATRERCG